jgi:hypothetical protein
MRSHLAKQIEQARAEFADDPVTALIVTRLLLAGAAAGVLLVTDNLPPLPSDDAQDAIIRAERIIRKMEKHL